MKAIYHAMNMFNLDVTQRCLIAECWCPVKDIPEVQAALARGTVSSLLLSVSLTPSLPLSVGEEWSYSTIYPEQDVHLRSTTYIFQNQQVHLWIPGNSGCIWNSYISGSLSSSIYHHHLPFPLCCHVWRCRSWSADGFVCRSSHSL